MYKYFGFFYCFRIPLIVMQSLPDCLRYFLHLWSAYITIMSQKHMLARKTEFLYDLGKGKRFSLFFIRYVFQIMSWNSSSWWKAQMIVSLTMFTVCLLYLTISLDKVDISVLWEISTHAHKNIFEWIFLNWNLSKPHRTLNQANTDQNIWTKQRSQAKWDRNTKLLYMLFRSFCYWCQKLFY